MIDVKDDRFGAVLNCAVRYAIGRRTYMPSLVIGFISPLVPDLSTKTLWCLKRDISEAAKANELGDACDASGWLSMMQDINRELGKRGAND